MVAISVKASWKINKDGEMAESTERWEDTEEWQERTVEETMAKYPHAWPDETPPIPEITKSTIRRFAYGIGDDNPLWIDEEYAKKTKYGSIIAPPIIVVGCGAMGIIRGQLPPSWSKGKDLAAVMHGEEGKKKVDQSGTGTDAAGFTGWYSGSRIKWFRTVRPGDHLRNLNYIAGFERKPTKLSEDSVLMTTGVDLFNPGNELVCRMHNWGFGALRRKTKEKSHYMSLKLKEQWSDEELKPIWEQYEKEYEQRRGADPRYWENVEMGEEWNMVKGPYTGSSGIAYTIGAIGETFIKTDRLAYKTYVRDHPAVGIKNEMNIPDAPVRVHWENDLTRREGIPAAYDFGGQRIAWLAHMMTDWIGDDGFLKTLEGRFVKFNYLGDVQWFTATVVDKFVKGDDHMVTCELIAVNQRDEITTTGRATVVLPSRTA